MGCKCMALAVGGKKKNRYLVLDGEITIDTVADHTSKIVKAISKSALYQVDLSKIEQCDIAGLQMIYSMFTTLVAEQKEFLITEISQTVTDLLTLTGLSFPDSPSEMVEA